jgi:hypothetical protein
MDIRKYPLQSTPHHSMLSHSNPPIPHAIESPRRSTRTDEISKRKCDLCSGSSFTDIAPQTIDNKRYEIRIEGVSDICQYPTAHIEKKLCVFPVFCEEMTKYLWYGVMVGGHSIENTVTYTGGAKNTLTP